MSQPTPQGVASTAGALQHFLRLRYSIGLFRMITADEVQANLSSLNTGSVQIPGSIVIKLDSHGHNSCGAHRVVVFFSGSNVQVSFTNPVLAGINLHLDPVQSGSSAVVEQRSTMDQNKGRPPSRLQPRRCSSVTKG